MNFTNLDLEVVDNALNDQGYLIVRDPALEKKCAEARIEYEECFKKTQPRAPRDPFDFKQLRERPWRKMAIGSKTGLGETIAQNLQTIYFYENDMNYPAMNSLFGEMIKVRNKLMRVSEDFGNVPERDGFWNACRIHHYPRGGGFMTLHRDTYFPDKLEEKGKPFYQMLVLLSRKGVDFVNGGGVLISHQGNKVDIETEAGFGSMVLYDGRTPHGVEDVDPDQVIDFSRIDGRLVAIVNVYCVRQG
jgi:hypothetical protein